MRRSSSLSSTHKCREWVPPEDLSAMRGGRREGRRDVTPAIARGDARLLTLGARLPLASTRHLAVLSGGLSPRLESSGAGLLGCVAGPPASGVGRSRRGS